MEDGGTTLKSNNPNTEGGEKYIYIAAQDRDSWQNFEDDFIKFAMI